MRMTRTSADIHAVLFDLDGTFADTAPDMAGALNNLRRQRGLDPVPMPVLRPHASSGARGMMDAGFNLKPAHPDYPALRYWLFWGLFLAGLAFAMHRYFEYRNQELDRRIERLG